LNPLQALVLGILQGLTEFLPVSSSGHLVLGQEFLGVKEPGAGFVVFAHAGTLLAILLYYRSDLISMAASVLRFRRDRQAKTALLIVVGSIPAAIVGFGLRETLEGLFEEPVLAASMLLVTGLILLATRFAPAGDREVGPLSAFGIGAAQAFAILPGISRSGATISAGLFLGIDRREAARFSFLLAIPAILGPTLIKAKELIEAPAANGGATAFAIGAVAAFVSGWFALRLLLRIVANRRLDRFGWYCLAAGTVSLVLLLA